MKPLETVHSFDLEVLGEIKRILGLLTDNELVAVEQRNRAEFCVRYCEQLERRLQQFINN